MKKITLIISTFCLVGVFQQVSAQSDEVPAEIILEHVGVSRPLRELAAENPVNLRKIERENFRKRKNDIYESKDRKNRKPQEFVYNVEKDGSAYGNDSSIIQKYAGSRPGPSTKINVNGINNGSFPHDPSGAAGPNYYVQAVNATTCRVINKTTGATIQNFTMGTLWTPDIPNDGDPIVMYDRFADRWFLAQFGTSGNKIYIAVSTTNDPLGSYYTYTYTSLQFPDYLKFSIWHDGYYMTANTSTQRVFAFERSLMLTGGTARAVSATFNPPRNGFFCPLPGDADGNQGLPASGACPIFSYSDNAWGGGVADAIQIYQMAVNWTPATPTATISFVTAVPTAAFDASYNFSWNDIAQPGTTAKLDGIGGVLTYRAQWRKWNGYNSVVVTWGVKISNTQRSIMWAELRQNQANGAWSMYQQGIYTPDNYYRWISSIAMDDAGNIALCYTKSGSSTIYPGLYYTGRLATDPLNQMTFAESTAIAGIVSQNVGINRWGDYSHTSLDPDGSTFWHTAEWAGGTSSSPKRTRVYSFQLAMPTNANVAITSSDADNVICAGSSVTFTATPTNGGSNPTYQWYVNGTAVPGATSTTYVASSIPSGAVVTCIMTSNMSGATNNPATSNAIITTVNPIVAPTISVFGNTTYCSGTNASFVASAGNAGASPVYQWQVNGANAGTNSSNFSTTSLTNGAVITCTVTSSASCVSPTTATSTPLTITINASPPTPTITNSGGVLTSSAANGNQWYLNGNAIPGATGQSYTPTANGTYSVTVTINGCSKNSTSVNINGLSLEEIDKYAFNIYPNPSMGDFTITMNAFASEKYSIKVYDEIGKLVFQDNIENQNGTYAKEVKLGKVASGVYNVVLSNGINEINKKVVVKK